MSGLVINGVEHSVDGVRVVNFLDEPALRLHDRSYSRRRHPVKFLVWHTTKGLPTHEHPRPQSVLDVPPPEDDCTARRTVAYWQRPDARVGGAHCVVDADGTVLCLADLLLDAAYHCVGANHWSVGIEVTQQGGAELYREQLRVVGLLSDYICTALELPRVVAMPYRGCRAQYEDGGYAGGLDGVGVLGHRDASTNRGFGDPGDLIMAAAMSVGQWATG